MMVPVRLKPLPHVQGNDDSSTIFQGRFTLSSTRRPPAVDMRSLLRSLHARVYAHREKVLLRLISPHLGRAAVCRTSVAVSVILAGLS
jgi:hypothetical protein